jgi:hypothetical protein
MPPRRWHGQRHHERNRAHRRAPHDLEVAAAALLMPQALSIIGVAYSGVDRVRALSIYGMTLGVVAQQRRLSRRGGAPLLEPGLFSTFLRCARRGYAHAFELGVAQLVLLGLVVAAVTRVLPK